MTDALRQTGTLFRGLFYAITQALVEHGWVLLTLTVIGLAYFSSIDYGNRYGLEEWAYHYTVLDVGTPTYFDGRPLVLWPLFMADRLVGVHPLALHGFHAAMRILTAFAIYLLVREISSDQPAFAFLCAAIYLVYIVRDDYFIRSEVMIISTGYVLLPVLAVWTYLKYTSGGSVWYLLTGLALGAVAMAQHDSIFPSMGAWPVLIFLAKRDFSRRQVMGVFAWIAVVLLSSLRIVLPVFGLAPITYATGYLSGYQPSFLLLVVDSLTQLKKGLLDILVFQRARLFDYRLPIAVVVTVALVCLHVMRHKLPGGPEQPGRPALRRYTSWLVGGVVATWLGFAAYLPTVYIRYIERVHVISAVGEAITLAAGIWLVSLLVRNASYRWLVRMLAVGFVAAYGTAQADRLQSGFYALKATWDTEATYLRSLANIAPAVEKHTLFVYVQDPAAPYDEEALAEQIPFLRVWSFEYAIKFLYRDAARGILTSEFPYAFFHTWEMSDEGIEITPQDIIEDNPLAQRAFYGWDEMILLTKDTGGRAVILDTLPGDLFTEERASLYQPYARIHPAFVSDRVQRLLPPLQVTSGFTTAPVTE